METTVINFDLEAIEEAVIKMFPFPDVTVKVNQSNVWIDGNTRPIKELLKAAGYKFSGKRAAWWKPVNDFGIVKAVAPAIIYLPGPAAVKEEEVKPSELAGYLPAPAAHFQRWQKEYKENRRAAYIVKAVAAYFSANRNKPVNKRFADDLSAVLTRQFGFSPDGYNKLADTDVTIINNNVELSNLSQTVSVINKAGTALPSTGGIGTTIFYITGMILVIFAGVMILVHRRTDKE